MISPEFERLSTEYDGIVFLKVDVDEVDVSFPHAELSLNFFCSLFCWSFLASLSFGPGNCLGLLL